MSETQTITINSKQYDAHTGMPIEISDTSRTHLKEKQKSRAPTHSKSVHHAPHKSKTLHRSSTKRPSAHTKTVTHNKRPRSGRHMDIARSTKIAKFAPHPAKPTTSSLERSVKTTPDLSHTRTVDTRVRKTNATHPSSAHTPKTAQQRKQESLASALETAPTRHVRHKESKNSSLSRTWSVASASLALVVLGGYFTYLNMPSLSVRVAAARAGIDASYPDYRPDGYRLNGPIAFSQGEVSIRFSSTSNNQDFTVSQSKSSWDSSSLLENHVRDKAGNNYMTYNERGLTIYTYDGNAAWVNGGVMYTIDGNAPLSGDQIRRIATSL